MPSLRREIFLNIFSLSDLGLLLLVLYLSIFGWAAFASLLALAHKQIQVHTIVGIITLAVLWRAVLPLLSLYQSKRLSTPAQELMALLRASGVATVLLAFAGWVFGMQTITPTVLLRFFPLSVISLVASRLVVREGLKALRRRGRNLRHMLVVGTNARAIAFVNSIEARPELGYRIVGFVDDAWVGPHPANGVGNVVSDVAGFLSYLRSHVVDEVVIGLPVKSHYKQAEEIIRICEEHGVIARILTSIFDAPHLAKGTAQLGAGPAVSFCTIPNDELGLSVKRALDIIVSSLLIVLFGPIMLAVFILIKMDSKGPVLFAQERIGINKRRFLIYKFRTMVVNAEDLQKNLESMNEAQGPVFKIKNDPRITRIGRFLRKTSIDELPQLFNVLKGDMSLVGPRPINVRDYTGFSKDWQRRRFSIRPGITCLWQVSGRSNISFDQWMHLDIEYIDRWSLWLDIKILARTIPAVVRGSGAV